MNEIIAKFAVELGASAQGPAILIGEQLGLYKALSAHGPLTPEELAKKTGTAERYIREWLAGQAAGGYVNYDAATGKYMMTPEQAFVLANEDSPVYIPGAFYLVSSIYKCSRHKCRHLVSRILGKQLHQRVHTDHNNQQPNLAHSSAMPGKVNLEPFNLQ